jgi:PAS domain-containing protein
MRAHPTIDQFLRSAATSEIRWIVEDLADLAIVVRRDGIVRDVPHARAAVEGLGTDHWRGRPFGDTIAEACRAGAGDFLAALWRGEPARAGEFVHSGPGGRRLTLRYGGGPLDGTDDVILLGRTVSAGPGTGPIDYGDLFAAGRAAEAGIDPSVIADILVRGGDLVVLMDAAGRMIWANEAFHAVVRTSRVSGIGGRFLEDLVAFREPVDLDGLIARTDAGTAGTPVPAILAADPGDSLPVTITLTRLPRAAEPVYGAVIRPVVNAPPVPMDDPSATMVTALVDHAGQVPLKDIVRGTAEVVERQCLQAALKLTGNNRSAAARALGISRQALYQKLEKFDLLDA